MNNKTIPLQAAEAKNKVREFFNFKTINRNGCACVVANDAEW